MRTGRTTEALERRVLLSGSNNYALEFSTYLGGSGYEQIRDVVTDRDGNVYVTGGGESPDFPTTPGAFATSYPVGGAGFVTKLLISPGAADEAEADSEPERP